MAPPSAEVQPQRIAIEREEDWLRVQNNVKEKLKALVDKRMASEDDTDGKLRKEVEARIAEKFEQIFQLAVPNLRVNGHNYEEYLEMTEPFDEALDSRMFGLQRQAVEYQMHLSGLRRKVPGNIVDLEGKIQGMTADLEWTAPESVEVPGQEMDVDTEQSPNAARRDEIAGTFKQTLQNLDSLAKVMSSQVQRADRARAVKEHIQQLPA